MTANVNNWLANREKERANKALEKENVRHNTAVEVETERHNRAMEEYNLQQLAELQRNNVAIETLRGSELAEAIRHAQVSEGITTTGQLLNYEVGMGNVGVGYAQVAESNRHNIQQENLTRWDNLQRHSERQREIADQEKRTRISALVEQGNLLIQQHKNELQAADITARTLTNSLNSLVNLAK